MYIMPDASAMISALMTDAGIVKPQQLVAANAIDDQ